MRFRNIPIRNIISEAMNTGGIIIDVRTKAEFDSGHIPLALNVPLDTIKSKNYRLPKSKTLLVYCMHEEAVLWLPSGYLMTAMMLLMPWAD